MARAPIVYFHGMPGGPGEWDLLAPAALQEGAIALDRNSPNRDGLALVDLPENVTVIGFSLGAPPALRLARQLGERVEALHLVSPAAPLQLGSFLPDMAGGALFALAARHPRLFRLVVAAQCLLARHAPALLLGRLFATARGGDARLWADPGFRTGLAEVLRKGLGRDARGFAAEVAAFVADWREELAAPLPMPVTIWQGSADNWTPPAMAHALHASLPGSRLVMLDGCSHYSALHTALARIAAGE